MPSPRRAIDARNTRRPGVRSTLRTGAIGALLLAPCLLAAPYALSVLVSDRYAPTQWLAWIPRWPLALACVLALLPAAIRVALGARTWSVTKPAGTPRIRMRIARRAVVLTPICATLAVLAHAAHTDHGLFRVPRIFMTHAEPSLRVLYWNATGASPATLDHAINNLYARRQPDLYIIAHAPHHRAWTDSLVRRIEESARAPSSDDDNPSPDDDDAHDAQVVRAGVLTIVSRLPVTRVQTRQLGLNELLSTERSGARDQAAAAASAENTRRSQPGQLVAFDVDATALLGEPVVVWAMDLPSDPALPRMHAAHAIVDRLGGPAGAVAPDAGANAELHGSTLNPPTDRWIDAPAGLARADILVGDFNMTRNAASLRTLVGTMRHAYDHIGTGPSATWPRTRPLLHIDHVFLAPRLFGVEYRTIDPDAGTHRAVFARVKARPARQP